MMDFENLDEINKIYNFQGTIILCEVFEQHFEQLQKLFKYNPWKCNSASSFNGCAQRDQSKCSIAVPTDAEHVSFWKNPYWSFQLRKTRLAFDTQILISDKKNEKVLFDLVIGGIKQTKRIVSKILKIDKDNQYGQAMTKTLAYGCIKKQK